MTTKIKLIVGLGNPGAEYSATRHNAGAWFVENFLARHQQTLKSEPRFFGKTARVPISNQDVRFLVPETFMNLSGKAVSAMAHFYQIVPEEILVVHDELDLLPGVARLKFAGGHGGHNGLKDIINKLGNIPQFYRLRIGIGHPGDKNRVAGFVLSPPLKTELPLIEDAIDESVRCTEILLSAGMTMAMNRLHSFRSGT